MTLDVTGPAGEPSPPDADMSTRSRTRVAVGVFNRKDTLGQALDELALLGLPKDSLMLLFEGRALDGALTKRSGDRRLDGVPAPLLFMRGANGDAAFRRLAGRATALQKRIIDFAGWIEPRMAAALGKHVDEGACLLLGIASTPEEEQAICGVLIEHSLGQVQVHDLWL